MRQNGYSLIEVMVMMFIINVAIVGIYTLIHNGQKLATLTDQKLIAMNIAREGIESVVALRDTFDLRSYHSDDCFFTTDGKNYGLCPLVTTPQTTYRLTDIGTLEPEKSSFPLCVDSHGWYTQTQCASFPQKCDAKHIKSCQTNMNRKISFLYCGTPHDLHQCVKARVLVWWGTQSDQKFTLEQELTKH